MLSLGSRHWQRHVFRVLGIEGVPRKRALTVRRETKKANIGVTVGAVTVRLGRLDSCAVSDALDKLGLQGATLRREKNLHSSFANKKSKYRGEYRWTLFLGTIIRAGKSDECAHSEMGMAARRPKRSGNAGHSGLLGRTTRLIQPDRNEGCSNEDPNESSS